MKFSGKRLLTVISVAMLLVAAQRTWASVKWEIADGDPEYFMSDAIVVRNSPDVTFDVTAENPVGLDWQDPIAGRTNYVWVRVRKNGDFTGGEGQAGHLRLFIGQSETLFEAADYDDYNPISNSTLLDPPETTAWNEAEWDMNLTGGAVVPIRWQAGPASWFLEYVLNEASTYTPGATGFNWLRFTIEPHRLPSTDSQEELPFSLVAYIYDPLSYDGGNVTTNLAMAERRFNIIKVDYGDAPDPVYPTLLANNGASHLSTGIMLGATRDGELDGQPSADADGDDAVGADDEDGVVFHDSPVPGAVVTMDVIASADGFLNAWVDFNLDGDWNDAGEQIFSDQVVTAGVNNLGFTVPASAPTIAAPYARFRINSTGGLIPTGQAPDGEVEDYQVKKAVTTERGGDGSNGGGCFLNAMLF